ncbi:hypothetical protein DSO57_1039020 [Entomophthora muscae]|nr:hypothetical protein DSO57_1039020 [Entomophthora muscae]
MKGGFVIEFDELGSPLRSERTQGGGFHGNAILSKHDMAFQVIDHKYQPVDWGTEGAKFNEPRLGRRFTLVAEISTPFKKTLCYSAHLEVFCGLTGRVLQFSEILEHSLKNSAEYPYQLVFGDLNTMAHSIARLSPVFCCDRYRWRSLGFSEAEWWWKYLFSWHVGDGPVNEVLAAAMPELANYPGILKAARNPGLYDPWDPSSDITLHNPGYLGLYKAKLDWTLLRGFKVLEKSIGNQTYTASDHAYLALEINRCEDLKLIEDPVKFHTHFPTPKTWISGVTKNCLLFGFTALAVLSLLKAQNVFIPFLPPSLLHYLVKKV